MIDVRNLRFRYSESLSSFALRGISFTLKRGEFVALMGTNGSGKTTFIHCLNGLIKPESGEVWIDNLSVAQDEELYEIRRKVGIVFQNPDNQIVATTVERDMAFGLENLGIPSKEMRIRIQEALIRFHLESYRDTPPHLLSGGERQRLALASIWVMKPDYFILDEPTSLLDPTGRSEVLTFLRKALKEEEPGVLLITQYPEEAMLCHRLVIMDRGKIVMDGLPKKVFLEMDSHTRQTVGVPIDLELEAVWKGNHCAHPD